MKTGSYTGLRFIGCFLFLLCIISMSGCVGKAEQAQETGALSGEGAGTGEETGAGQQENEEKPDIIEESVKESLSEAVSIDIAEEKEVDADYSQTFQGINAAQPFMYRRITAVTSIIKRCVWSRLPLILLLRLFLHLWGCITEL